MSGRRAHQVVEWQRTLGSFSDVTRFCGDVNGLVADFIGVQAVEFVPCPGHPGAIRGVLPLSHSAWEWEVGYNDNGWDQPVVRANLGLFDEKSGRGLFVFGENAFDWGGIMAITPPLPIVTGMRVVLVEFTGGRLVAASKASQRCKTNLSTPTWTVKTFDMTAWRPAFGSLYPYAKSAPTGHVYGRPPAIRTPAEELELRMAAVGMD